MVDAVMSDKGPGNEIMDGAPPSSGPQFTFRAVILVAIGAVAYGLLAYASIALTRTASGVTAIWLPDALAVALLLRFRLPAECALLGGIALAGLAAHFAANIDGSVAVVETITRVTAIWLAVSLARRWCGPFPKMDDIGDLAWFAFAAGAVAPIAATVLGTLGRVLLDVTPASLVLTGEYALSSALDMLIFAPGAMIAIDALRKLRTPTRRERNDWIILTSMGTSITLLVFYQTSYPLLFLIPPVVVAHAFRLGVLGTAFSTLKVATVALTMTRLGHGPIMLLPYPELTQMLLLESFLASALVVGLPVAAMLATRDRIMAELITGKSQLALLADNITDAVLRFDRAAICTYASPSTREVLGQAPAMFLGHSPEYQIHPQARDTIHGVIDRMRWGKSEHERVTYRRFLDDANGQPVYIEADCALARNPVTGAPDGVIVSARDITHRVELENQLKRARDHAEAAARAKAQFLANMSHEIRTPMNGVLGFSEMLLRMDLPPEAARHAELIDRSGRSMMLLLNDILDISKIESGQMVIQRDAVDVPQLVEDCVQLHLARATQKGVQLALVCHPDVPHWILGDQLRLRQILLNLIGNAVKFTEEGIVEVSVMREGGRLSIAVEDTGIGIRADRLDSVFDPFVQAESSTTRRFGGTGLGLSISRQLAGLLGGNLMVDSMPGVGSRFTLRIPLEVAEQFVQQRRASDEAENLSRRPARVLLAEDHDVNRVLVTAMLEELGQEVSLAHDGTEAIDAIICAEDEGAPFDLVLMDIQMPGCDGYSATRTIRQMGIGADQLPIIALTANAYAEDIEAARDAGMQAHLAKPLDFVALAAVLTRWLPVRIIAEKRSMAPLPNRPVSSQPVELVQRWDERRREAIDAVSKAVRSGVMDGIGTEELASIVHKLAGTAGMFGEEELGRRAALLERALKDDSNADVRRQLAEALLKAA